MKKANNILAIILAILMVIFIIPITASAEKLTSGPCGYNLTWTFDESTGTLTISGTGEMYDDIHRYYPSWHGYISSIESVVISQGVTTIGDSTFCNNENIKNVSIADSVTDIGDEAFYNCTDLTNVVIGDGVTTIGYRAFYNCDGLTDVVIGKGVTVIDDYAFNACSNLKTVTIYNAVETIGEKSFNCPKLTDVYYLGTEAEWNAISKGSIIYGIITGTGLEKATIHFLGEETHECSYNAVVTAPTCTEQGYTTYTCVCGDSYVDDYVNATGHNYSSEITVPATHTATGVMTYTCTCGDSYTEVIEKLEKHNYESVVTAPTCTEQGYTTYTCECGDSYVDDYVDAKGHNHTSEITTPATHTTTGIMTYTCACGDSYTEVIAKLEKHNYESVVTAPTCTAQGYTTYTCECGDSYDADYVDALGHTEETIPAVAPTCTETGLTEGTQCSVCGETLTEQKELPANGHTPASAVEENYVAPTCTESGIKDVVIYCTECDKEISRETETIEATGHADNDGDGYCDDDDELLAPSVECDHSCHKGGIAGFFWRIINFFNKIFGLNKTCDCGVVHY